MSSLHALSGMGQGGGFSRDLRFGTVDTWVAWSLSGGAVHVTEPTNAALTGLFHLDGSGWNLGVAEQLRIPPAVLPIIVDSSGVVGVASALAGSPPIAGMAGDQQASLLGQGCVRPGMAKLTFGTGGMLDPAAFQATVDLLLAAPGERTITREPEGAWTHEPAEEAGLNEPE